MKNTLTLVAVAALAGSAAAQPAPPTPAPDPATPEPTPEPDPTAPAPAPDPAAPAEPAKGDKDDAVDKVDPAKDKKQGSAGYDKGFFIKAADDRFTLKITGRVQPFFTSRTAREPIDLRNAFEIRRARLTLEGNLHTKALAYKLQTDFGRGFVTLKDFYIDAELGKGALLRAGQWKRPFSRQQIASSARLEITDRSITDRVFLGSRDIGLGLHNNYEKSPRFEWVIGVFNGTGDAARFTPTVDPISGGITGGSFSNVPGKLRPVWVARAGYNHGGIRGYSEADLEGGPLRLAVAANLALEGDNDDDDRSQQRAGIDWMGKSNGFSTAGGVYVLTEQDNLALTDQALAYFGFHVQAGYMVTPKAQVAARYAYVDARLGGTDEQEISVGGNYYAFGHDAKLAGAVRLFKTGSDGSFEDDIRLELGANIGF